MILNNTKIKTDTEKKFINIEENINQHKSYTVLCRIQDLILSLLAFIVLLPFVLIISLIIVIDSPGASPIFVQDRVGKNGKLFKFYKFRSMCPGAENMLADLMDKNEMDGPVFKIKDDPRVSRFGKFLRKSCLDELPQLLNIIKGDMSIVGPRPALPNEVAEYSDYEKQRLIVTPGLSCYWQITPDRNNLSFDEWMRLDIKYIEERKFLVDWKIIFKSIAVCFGFSGI